MALTVNLKKQVDLPVWEWCRFAPVATSGLSGLTTNDQLTHRYLYYMVGSTFFRYDTITDGWQQLASPVVASATLLSMKFDKDSGYEGRVISATSNTVTIAGLMFQLLRGYKIRITRGTGAGQVRTITAVADPVVHDDGVVTTASLTSIVDASTGLKAKQWPINKWRDYSVRIIYGGGQTQTRKILYNNANTLTFTDNNYSAINPNYNSTLTTTTSATAGSQSLYTIESSVVTVDTNWDITPDATSEFLIETGGIWLVTSMSSAPFFYLMYYSIAEDVWYYKSCQSLLFTAALGTDAALESPTTSSGVIKSGIISGATNERITDFAGGMTKNRFANYQIRITSGAARGQTRTILANNGNIFFLTRPLDILPSVSDTYEIYEDTDKLYLAGGGLSTMLQYSKLADQWTTGKQFDFGVTNNIAAKTSHYPPLGLSAISTTSSANAITGVASAPTNGGSNYRPDDILTVTEGTGGTVRVLTTGTGGAVTSVVLESCGSGYTTGSGKTTSGGNGTGCTINIASVGFVATATTVFNHNLKQGDTVVISGASQSGYNGTKTIIAVPSVTTFSYIMASNPGAATAVSSQSTTLVVDPTKNWTTNEHVGKLVQLSTPGPSATGQVRRIVSNTATTLTVDTLTVAAVNGTSRYIIQDMKPFGTEIWDKDNNKNGSMSIATGGTTTTLVDTTKNWEPNIWIRGAARRVRILAGTGKGAVITITGNTSNTLTFSAQSFSPDTTTVYEIMDNYGMATGGSTTTLVDSTQNWATNIFSGKRVRMLGGTNAGAEYTITSNTANTLTFATAAAPSTDTPYAVLQINTRGTGLSLKRVYNTSLSEARGRYYYSFRGGATVSIDRYDVATEQWAHLTYTPQTETYTTGSMYVYDGDDRLYFTRDATGRVYYLDLVNNIVALAGIIPYGHSTAIIGNRMEIIKTEDGLKYLYIMRHTGQEMWRTLLFW